MPLENNPQNITDAINASGVKNFNLAFVLDSGGCTPAWGGDANHKVSSDTTVTAVVNAVRARAVTSRCRSAGTTASSSVRPAAVPPASPRHTRRSSTGTA